MGLRFFAACALAFWLALPGAAQPKVRLAHLLRAHEGPVLDVAVAPNGQRWASAGQDGKIRFWDRLGRPTGEWNLGAPVRHIRFSQDGTRFVAVSKGVARYFTAAGKALQRVSIGEGNLAFSADLRLVARSDGGLTVFEVGATRPVVSLKTLGWEGSRVQCLAISPDRRKVVLGGSSYNPAAPGLPDDSVAWEYDLVRGKLGKSETTGEFGTQWAAYAPDGRRALAGNRHPDSDTAGWLQLFPPVQGVPQAFAGVVEEVQFSPDARLMAVCEKETTLWDLRSGTRLASLGLGFPQAALANDFAVTGDSQGQLQIWEWTELL